MTRRDTALETLFCIALLFNAKPEALALRALGERLLARRTQAGGKP